MKTLLGLVAYMALGGLLYGGPIIEYSKACGIRVSATEGAAVMATWPAWLAVAMVTGSPETKCGKPVARTRTEGETPHGE